MLWEQTFSLSDLPRIAFLTFLEIVLSADNAVVLALLVKDLTPVLRKRALYIGFASAFVLRFLALSFTIFFFQYPWIQGIGAAYLLYLSAAHFMAKRRKRAEKQNSGRRFWTAIAMVELFDLAFAIDSIVAGVAFIGPMPTGRILHPKLWIVYIGGLLGALAIRYAADLLGSLLKRFTHLETAAHLMIGWIGIKLAFAAISLHFPGFDLIFWSGLIALLLLGVKKRAPYV